MKAEWRESASGPKWLVIYAEDDVLIQMSKGRVLPLCVKIHVDDIEQLRPLHKALAEAFFDLKAPVDPDTIPDTIAIRSVASE